MRAGIVIGLMVALLGLGSGAEGGNADLAKQLYDQARQASDPQQKIKLLQESVAADKEYNAYLQLGKLLFHAAQQEPQTTSWGQVETAFLEAKGMAADDKRRADALAYLAQVYEIRGQESAAVACLRQAYKLGKVSKVQEKLKDLDIKREEQGMDAGYIKQALSSPASRACFGVEPSLDLRINFEYDRADLTAKGQQQVQELGRALTDSTFEGRSFNLIGHTDSHGTKEYNLDLSKRRAETVKNYLAQNFKLAAARLKTSGQGKEEPLYEGSTPEIDALNRRVQVQLCP